MSVFLPDCLVFKYQEFDVDRKDIDTTLYVLYDTREDTYLIRGQRKWSPIHQSCTYSYECNSANYLADFIQYIICPHNKVNEILYNYDNLPEDPNEITFELLNEYDHSDYEIAGYNNETLSKFRLLRNLRMLRNVSNGY